MAKRHQILPRVADAGHPRIGDDGAAFPSLDPPQNLLPPFPKIVLVVAYQRFLDAKVIQQLHADPGILGGDKIHRLQHLPPPGTHIPQVANGGAHNIQDRHRNPSYPECCRIRDRFSHRVPAPPG